MDTFPKVQPAGYEQVTVSSTAVGLTPPAGASRAVCVVEAQPLRYREDGTDPTATVGFLAVATTVFELPSKTAIDNFKAIRDGGTDAVLSVNYYKS